MKVLILGGSGQAGRELVRFAWPAGAEIAAPPRAELDICDAPAVRDLMASRPWSAVVNASAYTAVDKAETEVVAAWQANALGPAILAEATRGRGIPLVHVSTDYVFDGAKPAPYVEDDPTRPLGVYGASKLGGEEAVRTGNPRHAIVRTAWVVSPHRSNFLKTMLRLAGERDELRVVADQHGCPTGAADLAAVLAAVAVRLAGDPDAPTGTFHFANAGEATWHSFACEIMAASAAAGGPSATVTAIGTEDYPTPAPRPANSRLSTAKIDATFGITPRPWQAAVGEIVRALVGKAD